LQFSKFPHRQNHVFITGSSAATGHHLENSIPLSIFPIRSDKLCFIFCGLPGRGKTHIARRLKKYISFFHAVPVELYSTADYRRKTGHCIIDAEWFDPNNKEAQAQRDQTAEAVTEDMIKYLQLNENAVTIMDSTNPSCRRRANILKRVSFLLTLWACALTHLLIIAVY
jgi:tRNA uridine 5-carbamoylmethylation protein Kti12